MLSRTPTEENASDGPSCPLGDQAGAPRPDQLTPAEMQAVVKSRTRRLDRIGQRKSILYHHDECDCKLEVIVELMENDDGTASFRPIRAHFNDSFLCAGECEREPMLEGLEKEVQLSRP